MRGRTAGQPRRTTAALRICRQGAAEPVPGEPASSPFQRGGRLTRVLPFAAVAAAAEAAVVLPPGPRSAAWLTVSLVLLGCAAGAVFLPWERLPRALAVLVPLVYLGSVLGLIMALGGPGTGAGLVLLVPVIWTALYHRPWESGCVLTGLVGVVLLTAVLSGGGQPPDVMRRVVFLLAVATMMSVAAHLLRRQVRRSQAATARLQGRLRELSIVADRDRIAGDLHERVVARLFRAGLALQGVHTLSTEPEVTRRADAVVADLDESLKLLRETIFGLRGGLAAPGLRRAILDMSSEFTPVLGTVPEVLLDGPLEEALTPATAAELLAALRRALAGLNRPVTPSRVAVAVVATPGGVRMTVTGGTQQVTWEPPGTGAAAQPEDWAVEWEAGPGAALGSGNALVAAAQPDGHQPQEREDGAQGVHHRHHHPGGDHHRLQHRAGHQCPRGTGPADHAGEHDRHHRQHGASRAGYPG